MTDATLLVAWREDAGWLGPGVVDLYMQQNSCSLLAEIEPLAHFPLNGVTIEDDVARLPDSKFHQCPARGLVLFISDPPAWEWYSFLNTLLDTAVQRCHVKQILTVGGVGSATAHTTPRQIFTVSNSPQMSRILAKYDAAGADHETQLGQRPSMNSYLLWLAQRRAIPAASVWASVPFYLSGMQDAASWMRVAQFLEVYLGFGVDLAGPAQKSDVLNQRIAEARVRNAELDEQIGKLERNQSLS
ncbi:MAG: PAC2 family protein, partial [Chloroflexi bacterium]|nr:PAC2 family protein [Chloroflexota bacterium]